MVMLRRAKKTLRRAAKWISPSDPLILMYHRVSDAGPDPWGLAVAPQHFAEHLDVLRRHARPLALQRLQAGRGGNVGRQSVIVTFDDGYADNVLAALPLLHQYDIPATVFVATGHLRDMGALWWDELADLLLRPGRLPERLAITMRERELSWTLGPSVEYTESDYRSHHHWPAVRQAPPTERQALYLSLWQLLLPLDEEERRAVLDVLVAWSGNQPARTATHRMLSQSELAKLGDDHLVEVGAHSVTHPVLPALPIEAQRREVLDSKELLESLTEKSVTSFSYPYGRTSESTISVVRDAGFQRACSTRAGRVARHADVLDLPRIAVPDCDGEQFERIILSVIQ